MTNATTIPADALDSLSIAPDEPESALSSPACHPAQEAGQDPDIARRLKRDPRDADAKLDRGLDESMDASDPPAVVHPGDSGEPMPSSGFDERAEEERLSKG